MDIQKPDDQFSLIGDSWPHESESAYHAAKIVADDSSTIASTQAQAARDAEARMADEQGQTADAVSSEYGSAAKHLQEQSITYTTIAAWMSDAEGKVASTKRHIRQIVHDGTSEIRDAIDSELKGTPVTPSSNELIAKYQGEIASVKTTLESDLEGIGHSLAGDQGASRTPSYASVSTTPTPEHADPHASMASYTGTPGAPVPEPHQLPPMPRATSPSTTESPSGAGAPSTPSTPAAPHPVNPTLSNLVGGQGSTPSASSPGGTSSPHTPSQGSPSAQAHQAPEHRQTSKAPDLPRIPSLPLDGLPAAAAESVATVVSSAAGHQLSTAPSTITPSVPASTGFTPGTSGIAPATPMTPVAPGLSPIGGGGGLTPPVTQPVAPAPQGTPAAPSPTTPRSPAADATWIQRTYGLSPGIETPKHETIALPALFIADLPEAEAHLHCVLASLRQQFDDAGWNQPLAVATIRRGFETRCVYVTADGTSIHPHGVSLPHGVTPLSEMPAAPTYSELSGSIMVTDKLAALIPRGWEIENMLSTLPSDENRQSTEQYRELVGAGELLECRASRGRADVTVDEALAVFARAALGSGGCGELDVESARLRAARWVGVQPAGYLDVLSRYHLSDAADSMSRGNWGEALYASENYLSITHAKSQAA